MAKLFDAITKDIPLEGIDKFIVRGKEFYEDSMTNYYIVGSGHICDKIAVKKDGDVYKVLEEKVSKNRKLKEAVNEFKEDRSYRKRDLPDISCFGDMANWPADI
jgi:hypothetical protein